MNFSEALEALKEGKKVRRGSRKDSTYLLLGTKEQYGKELFIICSECYNRKYSEVLNLISVYETLADDWEIIEDEMLSAQIETFARNTFFCPYCLQWAQDVSKRDQVVKCVHCGEEVKLKVY